MMKSRTLKTTYRSWATTASAEQRAHVDAIYAMAESVEETKAGDVITECYGPAEILLVFPTLEEAADFLDIRAERAAEICGA